MDLFRKAFASLLEQDENKAEAPAPTTDKEAMAAKLDSAKPEDFNVNAPAITDTQKIKLEQISELKEWILKIDEFKRK